MKKEIVGGQITFGDGRTAPFSPAVRAGDFLFVAGQLGVDENFRVVAQDFALQTRKALENLSERLREGGSSIASVVKVNAYLARAADFAAFNEAYRAVFAEAPPARTTVVTALLVPDALVEIEAIALID